MRLSLPVWLVLAACSGSDPAADEPINPPAPVPEAVVTDPGSKPIHRMNRAEIDNTFRDLFGTDIRPAADLPSDEISHGFDNVAEGLTVGSVHLELLEGGIDDVLDELFGRHPEETLLTVVQGEGPGTSYFGGSPKGDFAYVLTEEADKIVAVVKAEDGGLFGISTLAWGTPMDGQAAELRIVVDDVELGTFPLPEDDADERMTGAELDLDEGLHTIELYLANPLGDIDTGERRSMAVDFLEFEGPLDPLRGPSSMYPTVVACHPEDLGEEACARKTIEEFGERAWRRPLVDTEVDLMLSLYTESMGVGIAWDESLQLAVKGLLMSPDFLYRVESNSSDVRPLDAYELASRLSYFLWSSTPDPALLTAARDGSLLDPEITSWHVKRMLEDDRARAIVDNFVGQWWDIRNLDHLTPDPTLYTNFDPLLAESMQLEMYLLADEFFLGGRDMREVLDHSETRVDARLAAHYGIAAPENDWDVVSLVGTPRRGLLSTGGWLAIGAHPDRPSPVRRGRWILDNLLCAPPPPPPPEVEGQVISDPILGSIREQEEARRADAYCQSCHERMDPMGFALNHFDAIGGLRSVDEIGFPIDAGSMLPDGTPVGSAVDLTPWIADNAEVPGCMVEQTLTYALGRAINPSDGIAVEAIEADFIEGGGTFDALADAIVASPVFRNRAPADAPVEETP